MRTLLLLCLFCLTVTSCETFGGVAKHDKNAPTADDPVASTKAPTDLEGPAYDPTDSPVPMTADDRLPVPPGAVPPAVLRDAQSNYPQPAVMDPDQTEARSPQAYGTPAPEAYGTTPPPAPSVYSSTVTLAPVLNGSWVNTADPREVVEFTPTHYKTYYDDQMLVEEDMTYHQNCPGDCAAGQAPEFPCFTIAGPGGYDCYGIIRLTDEVLELSLLGVSTEVIEYRKLQ